MILTANNRRTLEEVLNELTGRIVLLTKRTEISLDELKDFVRSARSKGISDYHISQLIVVGDKPLTTFL